MPSPNLIAAALSQRAQHMKIGVLGNILPLRQHPVRVAEEYAMLDVLRYFFSLWNRGFNEVASHAGAAHPQIRAALNTEHSFAYFREGNRERVNFHPLSWDDLDQTGFIIAGNPDAVARKLK
jgi:alkanesulfonate monooxygenase SsuD/methylene tetrahydromethanopterin reductase-like flavin-dependent oxidoreductase (luciferase family)